MEETETKAVVSDKAPSPSPTATAPRQPNRVKHEQQLDELVERISRLRVERGSLAGRLRLKRDQLAAVREEREKIIREKTGVFDQLEWANKEVRQKGDFIQKLRSGVSFSRAEEIDDQVRRLELQLARSSLKLPEERRLVTEIDRLKRSRRTLQEFNKEKLLLEQLRAEQQAARERRENWFRQSREAKAREDQFRADLRLLSEKLEEVKHRVEGLEGEQRAMVEEYRAQEYLYKRYLGQRKAEQRRRTEYERLVAAREEEAELAEIKATCEPLLAERQLCSALIVYCEGLAGSSSSTPSTPLEGFPPLASVGTFLALPLPPSRRRSSGFSNYSGSSSNYATPLGCSPATTPMSGSPPDSIDAEKPGYYKKKEDHDVFFAGSKKKTKKNRNERRPSFKKCLNHNRETYLQFSSVGVEPPTSFVNIPEVIQQLRDKLQKFELQAADIKAARNKEGDIGAESEEVPSITIQAPEVIQNTPAENHEEDTKTDRQKLTLDLGLKIVPEIRVNLDCEEAIISETPELKVENNGDSVSPTEENKAILCDKPGAENGLTLLPHSPLTNSNEGSFSPSCTLMKNLIIN